MLRFVLEPGRATGVESMQIGHQLQRDLASEPQVAGAIDLAHPACAK